MPVSTVGPLGALYAPLDVKSLHLSNRFALAPMTREKSPGGVPVCENAKHYRARAAGGVSLVITEGTYIGGNASGHKVTVPHFTERAAPGWKQVVDAVHSEGSAIIPQLWHVGALRGTASPLKPGVPPQTPSGRDLDGNPLGEPMTAAEIDAVVANFADAAALAKHLGFDGIELHGAHGYLIDEYIWNRTNARSDRFGSRMVLPTEIVKAVRAAVGDDFAVVFRFSQWKADHYNERIAESASELESILVPLADAGVDAFHASTRRHWLPEFPADHPALGLAGWAKRLTGKTVITVGSVGVNTEFRGAGAAAEKIPLVIRESLEERLEYLAEQYEAGEFDIVALGRALMADPAWVHKMRQGRLNDVVPFDRKRHTLSGA